MLVRGKNLSQTSFEYPKDWGQGNRGVWAGGGNYGNGTWTNRIDYINIVYGWLSGWARLDGWLTVWMDR